MADVPMLDAHMRGVFESELAFMLDRGILSGTGAGQPLGLLNSPALITVQKDLGQAPATISVANVINRLSRSPAPCRERSIWIIGEDSMAQLDGVGTFTGIFMPRGAQGVTSPRLKGLDVVTIEQAPQLGSVGDISLCDLSQYIIVESGLQMFVSAEAGGAQGFLTNEVIFRLKYRVDGKPAWASAITPFNGTQTRSPFVALAAR